MSASTREDSANDLIVPDSRWPSPRQQKEGAPTPSFCCTLCNKIANALPIYSVWFRIIPHFSLQLLRRDPVFPPHLTLPEQGDFFIGYYHQRVANYQKKEKE